MSIWTPIDPTVYEFIKRGGDAMNPRQYAAWLATWDGSKQIGTSEPFSMPSAAELIEMARLSEVKA